MEPNIRILQLGTTGQLGHALLRTVAGRADVTHRALGRPEVDFREPESVAAALRAAGPVDLVVNAAAYTAVDRAESEEEIAHLVNAGSVGALAKACAERNVPLIHISTDYVFDGTKSEPYVETDMPNPLNAYGRTKLEGENAIRNATDRHVILRTSWVYGASGDNFVKTMMRLGAERDVLRVVDDQYGAPTSAMSLADAILDVAAALASGADNSHLFGTFHFTDKGETTWCGFARAIFEDACPAAAIRARLISITTAEYPTLAKRPLNSCLDCTKFDMTFAMKRRPWLAALTDVMDELAAERMEV